MSALAKTHDLNAILKLSPAELQAAIPQLASAFLYQLSHESIQRHPVVRQAALAELHRRQNRRQLWLILASVVTAISTALTAAFLILGNG